MTNITTWIDEYHKGSRFGLNGKILIKKTSKYQEIIVIENEYYGKALMLDGCWMCGGLDLVVVWFSLLGGFGYMAPGFLVWICGGCISSTPG